jgi:hypothetical protein
VILLLRGLLCLKSVAEIEIELPFAIRLMHSTNIHYACDAAPPG